MSFLPVDRNSGKKRGIGFVRFRSELEGLKGIEIGNGRSWGEEGFLLASPFLVYLVRRNPLCAFAAQTYSTGKQSMALSHKPFCQKYRDER